MPTMAPRRRRIVETDVPVSLAPTVITNGSLPGAKGTPLGPSGVP